MTVKDYILLQNIMHRERYSNVNCAETGKGAKGAGSQLCGAGSVIRGSASQIRGARSEIGRDPPQFNRRYLVSWNAL